jgi:hypothetical protein
VIRSRGNAVGFICRLDLMGEQQGPFLSRTLDARFSSEKGAGGGGVSYNPSTSEANLNL